MSLQTLGLAGDVTDNGEEAFVYDMEGSDEDYNTMYEFARAGERQLAVESSSSNYIANDIDLDIADKDMAEALKTVQSVIETGDLQLEAGEARSYKFLTGDDKDAALNEIFVCDLSDEKQPEWASDYSVALAGKLQNMYKELWVRVLGGDIESEKKAMVIAGRAKEVGLAKEKFYAAMTMAGLEIKNGQYEKATSAQDLFVTRLQDHGFECKKGVNTDNVELTFDTIDNIPAQYRAEVCRVVLKNLTEDYLSLNKLYHDVVQNIKQRPEYERVKDITHHYRISEEALYHVLKQSISKTKIDPTGNVKKILDCRHELTEQLVKQQEGYRQAVQTVLNSASKYGLSAPEMQKLVGDHQEVLATLGIKIVKAPSHENQPGNNKAAGPTGPAGPSAGPRA